MVETNEATKEVTEKKGSKALAIIKNILIGVVGLMLVLAVAGAIARKFGG